MAGLDTTTTAEVVAAAHGAAAAGVAAAAGESLDAQVAAAAQAPWFRQFLSALLNSWFGMSCTLNFRAVLRPHLMRRWHQAFWTQSKCLRRALQLLLRYLKTRF